MKNLSWPPRRKKKFVVDSCNPSNNKPCPKPKPDKPDDTEEPEVKVKSGKHMNVRDLGSDPGDVRMQPKDNKSGFTITQEQRGADYERKIAEANDPNKKKLFFKKRKK